MREERITFDLRAQTLELRERFVAIRDRLLFDVRQAWGESDADAKRRNLGEITRIAQRIVIRDDRGHVFDREEIAAHKSDLANQRLVLRRLLDGHEPSVGGARDPVAATDRVHLTWDRWL